MIYKIVSTYTGMICRDAKWAYHPDTIPERSQDFSTTDINKAHAQCQAYNIIWGEPNKQFYVVIG